MIRLIADSLPEPFGAEDLFYVANDSLSLSPDQLYIHKSQIKNFRCLVAMNCFKSIQIYALYLIQICFLTLMV